MATEYIIPTSAELREIAQDKLPKLTMQDPVFDFFAIEDDDADLLMWEQQDNFTGLQTLRGLNGDPPRINRVGVKRFLAIPGVYGEFVAIDERELTKRRRMGSLNAPIDISELVLESQDQLLQRRLDRIRQICWTLATTGTFSVSLQTGGVGYTDTYAPQTFSSIVPWATAATATPLADMRAIQLLGRGHSVNFGAPAKAHMNRVTANRLLNNTNVADFYGRRTAGLGTFNSLPQMNGLLTADDLPTIVVYDDGYLDDSGTFQPFIANGVVVVVGQRPGNQPVGAYRMTRNANNENMAPGAYQEVIDTIGKKVPRTIEVHDGHNGGPVLFYPSAVVVMTVS